MTRGRKQQPLPSCFEENIEGLIRCRICLKFIPKYSNMWINRQSLKAHLNSEDHKKSQLEDNKAHHEQERATSTRQFPLSTRPLKPPLQPVAVGYTATGCTGVETQFWDEFDVGDRDIDFGSFGESDEGVHARFQAELDAQLKQWSSWTEIGNNEKEVLLDPETFEAGMNNGQDTELEDIVTNLGCRLQTSSVGDAWRPYPSKIHFLLDIIDTLPRLRISSSIMKIILWLLGECGVENVPSYPGLRKIQDMLRKDAGVPTIQWKSPKGNMFSFNDPVALVANDWSNPLVAPHLRVYPVIPKDGVVSEIWHASKWRNDMDRHLLSPMYMDGDHHYYIDEPAKLKDGRYVIPIRWLENEADCSIHADVWTICFDENALATINDTHTTQIAASELELNMLELEERNEVPTWSIETIAAGHPQRIPNPDRALAEGDPLYTNFVDIFGDDVSGNQSKSWNKHWNIYMTHRNLPRNMLQQQYNVHFVSMSQHASVAEQFQGVHERIKSTHDCPIRVKQATTGRDIRFKVRCNCGPGDNPSQSEVTGHIGGNGNFPCRKCHVGGSQKDKETPEIFAKFFKPGILRSGKENLAELETQIAIACLGKAQRVKEIQSETGIKDSSYTQYWIEEFLSRSRDFQKANPNIPVTQIQVILLDWVSNNRSLVYNPYLQLNDWDIARDTPVELLHTILLGIVKYLWHMTHTSFNSENKKKYAVRLQATDRDGLSISSFQASYMIQYANSLVGRQLKILAQVNIFHVYDLVDENVLALTRAVGELTALLWFPEIRDMEIYILDVHTAVANVLDCTTIVNPSKIIKKIKYHYLSHLEEDIRRFGPLIGVMTENYESYNSVFRACSILSNHLAPSRDIAHQLSRQETTKHILSGGLWYSQSSQAWVQPGLAVRSFIETNPQLRSLYGWPESPGSRLLPGSVTLEPQKVNSDTGKREYTPLCWDQTQGTMAINQGAGTEWSTALWYSCKKVISRYKDTCPVGSWVFASSPFAPNATVTGKIISILRQVNNELTTVVLLDLFETASSRHVIFDMPVLIRRFGEAMIIAVSGGDILFDYNVQHDCYAAKCSAMGQEPIRQERAETGATRDTIVHALLDQYVVNTHSLHNAHLVRETVSRQLIAPVLKYTDRETHHYEQAQVLQTSHKPKVSQPRGGLPGTAEGPSSHSERQENQGSKRRRVVIEETAE